jgi:hypothetical protein
MVILILLLYSQQLTTGSLDPTLRQVNPVHTLTPYILKIHFSIILHYRPRYLKQPLTAKL